MFKNKVWAILLAFALIFVFTGCGNTATEESTTDQEEETQAETSTGSDIAEEDTDGSIVGTWRVESVLETGTSTLDYTFNDDGTFTLYETFATGQPGEAVDETTTQSGTGTGTYTTDGDKLTVHFDEISSEGITYEGKKLTDDLKGSDTEYTYAIDGDELKLTSSDGTEEVLTKVATDTAADQEAISEGTESQESAE